MTGPSMIHDGYMATPYGVQIKIYRRTDLPPEHENAWVFDVEASALLAGIHDPAQRRRFAEETARQARPGAGDMQQVRLRLEDFGGHPVPRVPLPRPDSPLYPRMPAKDLTPVEAWVTGMMDHPSWHERAEFFIPLIVENMAQIGSEHDLLADMYYVALDTIMTAALEHLGEQEIACIEAAAFYAVSMHGEWAQAGQSWLQPFRETWLRDWLRIHPGFVAFASALRPALGLPDWLGVG
ncbi:hypothetical protein [Methylobacterium sp. ID0610]|uniref:hypothetical protein n=1 Tax=Methylobacterium carpenticola TaxID=3344827 RepID=UPI0036CAE449